MNLNPEALDARPFASFGSVFAAPTVPSRSAPVAELLSGRSGARATLTVSLEDPPNLPHTIRQLERHPFSTQTFIPLDLSRYLVVVAPSTPDGGPDLARARAFIGAAGQGVSYALGLWHAAFTVLDRRGSYTSLVWRDGSAQDEIFVDLAEPLTISL